MTFVDRPRFMICIVAACMLSRFLRAASRSSGAEQSRVSTRNSSSPRARATWPRSSGSSPPAQSPSSRNRLGKTALLLAAEKGNLAIVEALLRRGADVDQASIEGVTPLMAASYAGAAPVVKRLLAAGAHSRPASTA